MVTQGRLYGDTTSFLSLNIRPLIKIRSTPSQFAPDAAQLHLRKMSTMNVTYHYCIKRFPSLLERSSHPRFIDVVIDYATGLMWESRSLEARTIDEAEARVRELDRLENRGWRLPTLDEALSLQPVNSDSYAEYPQSYPFNLFESWPDRIWTADTTPKGVPYEFHHWGEASAVPYFPRQESIRIYVRCVRSFN